VIVAGTVAVLAKGLPYRLGLLLAMLMGMVVAMLIDSSLAENQVGDIE
jgi:hypothetical protein